MLCNNVFIVNKMKSWRFGICDVFLLEEINGDYLNGILIEYWEYVVMFYKCIRVII